MPNYDYSCTNCQHLVEVIHAINDPGPRFCPACGAEGTMRKGFSIPAVHFKGSGWAKKDRSSSTSSRSGSGSKTPAPDSSSSSAGGADGSADSGSGATTETKKSAATTAPDGGD